jgi:pilus assembly protein CpaF
MALLERLRKNAPPVAAPAAAAPAKPARSDAPAGRDAAYAELKSRVHNALFERLDLSKVGKLTQDQVSEDVVQATRMVLEEEKVLLSLD